MFNRTSPRIQVRVSHANPLIAIGLATALAQQGDIELIDDRQRTPAPVVPSAPPPAQIVIADYERGLSLATGRAAAVAAGTPGLPSSAGAQRAAAKVLVLTANDREHEVRSALAAGVDGYVELGCDLDELVWGVRQLARGSCFISPRVAQRVAASMTRVALTEREVEVLRLMEQGQSNKVIGQSLAISPGTVKSHMKSILAKLEADSRTQAARIARDRGLIDSSVRAA